MEVASARQPRAGQRGAAKGAGEPGLEVGSGGASGAFGSQRAPLWCLVQVRDGLKGVRGWGASDWVPASNWALGPPGGHWFLSRATVLRALRLGQLTTGGRGRLSARVPSLVSHPPTPCRRGGISG